MTAQGDVTNDHGDHAADHLDVAAGVVPCAACGVRPARPGRLRCAACLDAEWLRLRASDPAWYERHRKYHRQG